MHSYYYLKAAREVVSLSLKFSGCYQDWMITHKDCYLFFSYTYFIALLRKVLKQFKYKLRFQFKTGNKYLAPDLNGI